LLVRLKGCVEVEGERERKRKREEELEGGTGKSAASEAVKNWNRWTEAGLLLL